jgi:hypothetical protein
MLPRTTTLLKIWLKHHVLCLLEVLQHCPSQRRTLLASIGAFDPDSSNNIMFNLDNFTSRLSHQLAFQLMLLFTINTSIELFWMRELLLVSCR